MFAVKDLPVEGAINALLAISTIQFVNVYHSKRFSFV